MCLEEIIIKYASVKERDMNILLRNRDIFYNKGIMKEPGCPAHIKELNYEEKMHETKF